MLPLKPLPPLPQEIAEAAIPTAMQAEWILFGTCFFHHLMRLVEPKSMVKSLHPNEMEEGKEIYILQWEVEAHQDWNLPHTKRV